MDREKTRVYIKSKEDLDWLISIIKEENRFARNFIFEDNLFDTFFHDMEISQEEFFEKRYYYDAEKDIHISWCIDEGIGPLGLWISTFGLACYKGNSIIENSIFSDALFSQKVILSLLIKEARRLMDEEGT